jgi:hypothetical protein
VDASRCDAFRDRILLILREILIESANYKHQRSQLSTIHYPKSEEPNLTTPLDQLPIAANTYGVASHPKVYN